MNAHFVVFMLLAYGSAQIIRWIASTGFTKLNMPEAAAIFGR